MTVEKSVSGDVIVSKRYLQTFPSEFESHWVPHLYVIVQHLSKKLSKLLHDSETKTDSKYFKSLL